MTDLPLTKGTLVHSHPAMSADTNSYGGVFGVTEAADEAPLRVVGFAEPQRGNLGGRGDVLGIPGSMARRDANLRD